MPTDTVDGNEQAAPVYSPTLFSTTLRLGAPVSARAARLRVCVCERVY